MSSLPTRLRPRKSRPSLAVSGLGLLLLGTCGAAPFAHGCGPRTSRSEAGDEGAEDPAQQARLEFDVFVFGRQLGTVAPCGCTTEPLGGLQYGFGLLEGRSDAQRRLVLEPGSFLFPDPRGPEAPGDEAEWAQAEQRASVLQSRFADLGDRLVSGLGPTDLSGPMGAAALTRWPMPRVLANLDPTAGGGLDGVLSHRVVALGDGLRAGITAVVDPALGSAMPSFPATTDPVAAAASTVAGMRQSGIDLTVVMVHGPRELAERVAKASPEIDLVVVGGVLEGADRSRLGSVVQRVGAAYLVEPGDQAQSITHLRISVAPEALRGGLAPASQWALVPSRTQREQELLRTQQRLDEFRADPDADPAFVARLENEREALAASLSEERAPEAPVVAVFEQVKVTCHLQADAAAKRALHDYDAWVAKENQARFVGVRPPAPKKRQPGYVGLEECEMCHDEAAAYWKTTVHAGAYDTLVERDKQFDLSCVGCHVTGFRRPGGSEVVENHGLRAVQCEQCHGPGSLHVDDPEHVRLPTRTPIEVCLNCHTPEHSDTFAYEAYLRDVLGAGHGATALDALGSGPTGRELRAAGLAKAGGACKKM